MPSIPVKGMTCQHCVQSVKEAVSRIDGVTNVAVDLLAAQVSWEDSHPAQPVASAVVAEAIKRIGFDVN